jgi:hypothetical protein
LKQQPECKPLYLRLSTSLVKTKQHASFMVWISLKPPSMGPAVLLPEGWWSGESVSFNSLWHSNNAASLKGLCKRTDQPSAALVHDLKQRGLLDRTLVIWGGEFGRLPISQGKDGRDHNRHANSLWIAGGGFRKGYCHGMTDELGYKAVKDVVNVHDLHATLLHTLGLDHKRLTYPHDGRPGSLTDIAVTKAEIIKDLLA